MNRTVCKLGLAAALVVGVFAFSATPAQAQVYVSRYYTPAYTYTYPSSYYYGYPSYYYTPGYSSYYYTPAYSYYYTPGYTSYYYTPAYSYYPYSSEYAGFGWDGWYGPRGRYWRWR